eukprot:g26545.t1
MAVRFVAFAAVIVLVGASIGEAQGRRQRGNRGGNRFGGGSFGRTSSIAILKNEYLQKELNFTPAQVKRVKEIDIQLAGIGALQREDVQKALGITEAQKEKMTSVQNGMREKLRGLFGGGRRRGGQGDNNEPRKRPNFEDIRKKMTELRESTNKEVLAVLTTTQVAAFERMKGKKIDTFDKQQSAAKEEQPFFVINVAGVNRLLTDIEFVSRTAQHPEWSASVRAALALTGELKGIDRTRPAGIMAFINPGEAPEPVAIAYVPVTSTKLLRQTLSQISTLKLSDAADQRGRYTLKTADRTFWLKFEHRYALIARQPESLVRRIDDPAKQFSRLTSAYDIALRINFSAVPVGMKTMIVDYVRAAVDDKSTKRAGESQEQFQLRMAIAEWGLETLHRIARDGDRFTAGWQLSEKQRQAKLDLQFRALPKTVLARRLSVMSSAVNAFPAGKLDSSPASIAASWKLSGSEQRILTRVVDETERRLHLGGDRRKNQPNPFEALLGCIRQTIDHSHINAFVRILGTSQKERVLAGAIRIHSDKPLDNAVPTVLSGLQRQSLIEGLKLSTAESGKIQWNHFRAVGVNGVLSSVLKRHKPAMIAGSDKQSFWLATGSHNDPSRLQKQIVAIRSKQRAAVANTPLLQLSVRMSEFLPMLFADRRPDAVTSVALRSFRSDDDHLLVRLNADGRTLSLQTQFGMGYFRLIGGLLAR